MAPGDGLAAGDAHASFELHGSIFVSVEPLGAGETGWFGFATVVGFMEVRWKGELRC